MPPLPLKGTIGRSISSASHLSVKNPSLQGGASPKLSLSTASSPTLLGDGSLLLPSPHSPNASSSSSMSPLSSPSPFPFPGFKLHDTGEDIADHGFFLPTSPSISEIHLEIPDDTQHSSPLKCGDAFRFPVPEPRCDSWETANTLAKSHDKVMCDYWKEEIDKLLIFGGLFAATVVAFLIVSYQLLQPSPEDVQKATTNMIVALIHQYANGTLLSEIHLPPSPNNFHPSPAVLRMNVAWFLSMTMALSAVLVGTICLQWIREYQRDPRVSPKLAFAIRQMRWDGLQSWKVPAIISSLPILLQLSLLLFFWGLLEFLWSLSTAVTLINSVVIGAVLFFMVATIFLPALQSIFISSDKLRRQGQCPYKSPLARVFSIVLFWVSLQVIKLIRLWTKDDFLEKKKKFLEEMLHARDWEGWVSFDNQWQWWRMVGLPPDSQTGKSESCDIPRGLAWLGDTYLHNRDAIYALYHLLRKIHPSTSFEALNMLIARPDFNSFSMLRLASTATRDGDLLDDLHSALLLSHIASSSKDPHLQEALWPHRTELFIRISNYGAAASTRQMPGDAVEDVIEQCIKDDKFGINPFVGNMDFMKLTEDMMAQVLVAFRTYLEEAHVLHDVLWYIARQMVTQLVDLTVQPSHTCLVDELDSFNSTLSVHLSQTGDPRSCRSTHQEVVDRSRIHEYVSANQHKIQQLQHMGDTFSKTFRSLEDHFGDMPPSFSPNRRQS